MGISYWYKKENGEIDREKVIDELERDLVREPDEQTHIIGTFDREAVEGAVELLKAQEARVMTLEEVVSAECVWIEYAVSGNVIIAFPWNIELTDDTYNFICNPNCIVEFRSLYGEEWRCWTSRPTDEQREAVKWDG